MWAAMAAAGVALLGGGLGPSLDALGVVFALGAGAAWAAYILLNMRVGQAFTGGEGLALAMVFGTAILIVPGLIDAGDSLLDPDLLALGFGVALLSSVIPYSLELEALRRMPARVFGVLMSLEPALAALAGFLVLGQDVAPVEAVAIGLVVAASAGAARTAREPRPPID
jgi:inner membrane transporter RhtA